MALPRLSGTLPRWSALTSTRFAHVTPKPAHWGQCAPPIAPDLGSGATKARQLVQPRLLLCVRHKRHVESVTRDLGQLAPAEASLLHERDVFVVYPVAEGDRVVGTDGHFHPGVEEPADRVVEQADPGHELVVADRAGIERDSPLDQLPYDCAILNGPHAVLNAGRTQLVHDSLHEIGAHEFAGMGLRVLPRLP